MTVPMTVLVDMPETVPVVMTMAVTAVAGRQRRGWDVRAPVPARSVPALTAAAHPTSSPTETNAVR